jgi:hypothetical protein
MARMREWIAQQLKTHFSLKRILIFVAAMTVFAGRGFLQEEVKQIVAWLSSDPPPALTYQVISVDHLRSHEIAEFARREFGGTFNLQLDDNIIQDYDIFKVRIRNEGGPVENGFAIEAVVNKGLAKIVDLKHIVRAPANKSIPVRYSFPDVVWNTNRAVSNVTFTWRGSGNTEEIGFFLYRSAFKEFGYGKFNLGLIQKNCLHVNVKELGRGYYSVVAVGRNGMISDLSPPVRFPESLALQPHFNGSVWIDPSANLVPECSPNETRTYSSLKQAIDKEGPKRIFIVRAMRAESQTVLNQAAAQHDNAKILFEDDVKFLKGKFEVLFPAGLDNRAEIDFYFLTKGLPDVERSLSLRLQGQAKLTLAIRGEVYKDTAIKQAQNGDAKKRSLTPKLITTHASQAGIVFMWPKSGNQSYKGIRVFRSAVTSEKPATELGEEIYDGRDFAGVLHCDFNGRPAKSAEVEFPIDDLVAPSEPPTRNRSTPQSGPVALTAPTGLKASKGDAPVSYFTDGNARNKVKYKYTFYAYDSNENYSYPVEINASLKSGQTGLECSLVTTSNEKSKQ